MSRYGSFRINLFLIAVFLLSGLVLYRLFILSVVKHSVYSRTAQAQNENISNILARGNIYLSDRNGESSLVAANKKFPLAYIIPDEIGADRKSELSEKLAAILNLKTEDIDSKINSESKSLKIIARRISNDQVEQIKSLKIKGVGVSYESDRYYPGDGLAADVVGFLGYNAEGRRAGQYGLESFYDKELSGYEPDISNLLSLGDPSIFLNLILSLFRKDDQPSRETNLDRPSDLVLTLDKNIQVFIEDKLEFLMDKWQPSGVTIIVQEPESGKILAMADRPVFNSNIYSTFNPELFLNQGVQAMYEPGSSFKPITMSAGLDLSKITPQTSYEDVGFVNIAGYTIHNFSQKVFGKRTMSEVLEKSINTGTMFVENLIGDKNFLDYVVNMGFGQNTGIDLPGEVSGDITNLYSGRKINFLTASFGQGIAVTPLQLINAYSVIANGGKLMKPYVVEKIVKERGEEIITKPEVVGIPISEKTAIKLQSMLVSVVDNGFDKARIRGYDIAGKTGTAQIPDSRGKYSEDEFIHNFVGFTPAYNARFTVLIKMDRPKGIQFAADSLSPTFRDIAAFLINYYEIPPTRK